MLDTLENIQTFSWTKSNQDNAMKRRIALYTDRSAFSFEIFQFGEFCLLLLLMFINDLHFN